jgi:hypothetical protein
LNMWLFAWHIKLEKQPLFCIWNGVICMHNHCPRNNDHYPSLFAWTIRNDYPTLDSIACSSNKWETLSGGQPHMHRPPHNCYAMELRLFILWPVVVCPRANGHMLQIKVELEVQFGSVLVMRVSRVWKPVAERVLESIALQNLAALSPWTTHVPLFGRRQIRVCKRYLDV